MIAKGTIFLTPRPRRAPDRPGYAEIVVSIRRLRRKTFSFLNLPFPKAQASAAIRDLYRKGELRVVKVTRYVPPFQNRRYPLRIFTKAK